MTSRRTGPSRAGLGVRGALTAGLLLLLALTLLAVAATPALAARDHVFDRAFSEPGAGPGQLTEPSGLALNEASGELYVVDKGNNRVERFDAETGAFIGSFDGTATPAGSFSAPTAIAVDNDSLSPSHGDVYVLDAGHRLIDKFGPAGTYLSQLTTGGEALPLGQQIGGLAVDQSGQLWVYQVNTTTSRHELDRFSNAVANALLDFHLVALSTGAKPGVAVDSAGHVYVNDFQRGVVQLTPSGEVLAREIGSTGGGIGSLAGSLAADPADDSLYLSLSPNVLRLGPSLAPIEQFGPPQLSSSAGIALDSESGEVFVADPTADRIDVFGLEPTAAPRVDSTSATDVSATTATLNAEINPRSLPGEEATTYRFEYGTVEYTEGGGPHGTVVPIPAGQLAAAFAVSAVAAQVQGLAPLTTYHYRVIAENELGTTEGPDRSFATQPATSSTALPDGRGWELISPPDKHGSPLEAIPEEGGVIQAAADGSAIAYFSRGPIVPEPQGTRAFFNSQLLSRRGAAGGWATQDVSPPHQVPIGAFPGYLSEYTIFSADLSLGLLDPIDDTPLSPAASELTPYLRQPDGSYLPLVVGCPAEPPCPTAVAEAANVPAGTHFDPEEIHDGIFEIHGGVYSIAATPDLSHLVLGSKAAALLPGAPESGIYEWSAGALAFAGLLPPGSGPRCGGSAPACVPSEAANLGFESTQVRHAISADGSRLVLTAANQLYLRDAARGETLRLDAAQGVAEPSAARAVYQDASATASRVFFTDPERLTPDSTASQGKPDLYLCVVGEEAGHLACDLEDLTVDPNPGESADIQGDVIGASEDGSSVYFVANGALAAGAVHGSCTTFQDTGSGECNLYRANTETGEVSLVAVLSGADFHDYWAAPSGTDLGELTARVSPNGNWLAFMSERPLSGYDNRDAHSGERDEEVFLYHAPTGGGEGTPICASCNPTGARPAGRQGPPNIPAALVDRRGQWAGRWYAASIPGWTHIQLVEALYQSRYLSDSGRLFFNAADALVPTDTNGAEDVYQYEPAGVGGCTSSSATYSPKSGGCVGLISSGTSPEESAFMDASENGDDVFFLTASQLSARDVDTALDLYDARVGGGEAEEAKPVECAGDACQQPATPPNDPTPGSLTFQGAGNLASCPNGRVRKSGKCVKQKPHKKKRHRKKHHKKKPHKKHKKSKRTAAHNRGGRK